MIKCSKQENVLIEGTTLEIKSDFLNIVHVIEKDFDIDCEELIKLYRKEQQKSSEKKNKMEIVKISGTKEEILEQLKNFTDEKTIIKLSEFLS